jgi:hypothetical protein
LREEPDEERRELSLVVVDDVAQPSKWTKNSRGASSHAAAAPPCVDASDDATVVGGSA